jgi:hypothetical protein
MVFLTGEIAMSSTLPALLEHARAASDDTAQKLQKTVRFGTGILYAAEQSDNSVRITAGDHAGMQLLHRVHCPLPIFTRANGFSD